MENLLNKIFPSKCLFCSNVSKIVCSDCLAKAKLLREDLCIVCDRPSGFGYTHELCKSRVTPDRYISVFEYGDIIRLIIKNSKYGRRQFYALRLLTRYGLNLLNAETIKDLNNFMVLSVPLSHKKISIRGFNQADLIARELAAFLKLKYESNVVVRLKDTEAQYKFGRTERFKNLTLAFEVTAGFKERLKDRQVLIVDDISTTGATLMELAKVIKLAGADKVITFSLAKKLKSF